jgi:tRNA threonylcarbamoyladenosine biosynthesis protein TsaE
MEILSKTTKDTKELAGSIAAGLKPNNVLALYGDLGSGKTAFTSYLVKSLGIPARVQSPTFVIIRRYTGGLGKIKTVNHVDLYRLTDAEEIFDLGLPELIAENESVTVIEWPELAEKVLPEKTIKIYFDHIDEDTRRINVQNIDR